MNKLHYGLTDSRIREVLRIEELIKECCSGVDLILLFGEYVEGTPRNAKGGFEFLVLLDSKCVVEYNVISDHVRLGFPIDSREVKDVTFNVLSTSFFKSKVQRSEFLNIVFRNGVKIYESSPHLWMDINIRKQVKQQYLALERVNVINSFKYADFFLNMACEMENNNYLQASGFFLHHALNQLLMCLEFQYFGFVRDYKSSMSRILVVKNTSERLSKYFVENGKSLMYMYRRLNSVKSLALYNNASRFTSENIKLYTDIIMEIQNIVELECNMTQKKLINTTMC